MPSDPSQAHTTYYDPVIPTSGLLVFSTQRLPVIYAALICHQLIDLLCRDYIV
jgi:hypothetical protein